MNSVLGFFMCILSRGLLLHRFNSVIEMGYRAWGL